MTYVLSKLNMKFHDRNKKGIVNDPHDKKVTHEDRTTRAIDSLQMTEVWQVAVDYHKLVSTGMCSWI
jgi:hypothetical protein